MKASTPVCLRALLATLSLGACFGLATPALAGEPSGKAPIAAITPAPEEPWVHALLQIDISDHYITPRGLNVENEGVIFQPLFLVFTPFAPHKPYRPARRHLHDFAGKLPTYRPPSVTENVITRHLSGQTSPPASS